MNTPMFGDQDRNEVTAQFNAFGTLEITVGRRFDKVEISQWQAGASRIAGVKRSDFGSYIGDQTVLCVTMRPDYSTRTHVVRAALFAYTEKFLAELRDRPVQTSLF